MDNHRKHLRLHIDAIANRHARNNTKTARALAARHGPVSIKTTGTGIQVLPGGYFVVPKGTPVEMYEEDVIGEVLDKLKKWLRL